MLTTPFLTKLDPNEAVKGSRDPLGVQPIWSRLGRQVVGNLTTVSNSVRDFTVLLLGYYFAELVADSGGREGDLATFLKWEQLAAYARARRSQQDRFRGVERVERRLREGGPLRLSADAKAQILGNQKTYGLWGLYTVPGRASGMLEGDPTRLTPEARGFVEGRVLRRLESRVPHAARVIVERLRPPEYVLDVEKRDRALLACVAEVVTSCPPNSFYRQHLVCGGPGDLSTPRGTHGRQQLFSELLIEMFPEPEWRPSAPALRQAARRAEERGELGQDLAVRLERICTAELLLAPAAALFEFVLRCDRQRPTEIANEVRCHWGDRLASTIDPLAVEELWRALPELSNSADGGRRWLQLATALASGRYESAIQLVLEQNATVMSARSSFAPWAVVREDGCVQVKYRDEQLGRLPSADELPMLWRHAYFIESLRTVASSLRGVA